MSGPQILKGFPQVRYETLVRFSWRYRGSTPTIMLNCGHFLVREFHSVHVIVMFGSVESEDQKLFYYSQCDIIKLQSQLKKATDFSIL